MNKTALFCFALIAWVGCDGRQPVAGTAPARAETATDLGKVAPDAEFDFVIGMQLRAPVKLHKFLDEQSITQDEVRPEDFGDLFAVSAAEYTRMLTWLRAHDLQVVRTTPSRTTITVHGTAAAIASAFGTELHAFEDDAGRFVATIGSLQLSPDVGGDVSGVVGLSGESEWHSYRVGSPIPNPNAVTCSLNSANRGLGANDLQALYGYAAAGVTNPGMGETIAILGTGGAPSPTADVQAYVNAYGLGSNIAQQYKQIFVGGPNRDSAMLASQEYGENVLDAEMVFALAPKANVAHVFTATNGAGLFTDGIAYIVNDATLSTAHAVSVSYGECERFASSEMAIMNALFAQAQAEGQQWFFAAGDSATDGCRDGSGNKIISAGWPASSPYAVSVGGSSFGNNVPTTATVSTAEVPWVDAGGGPSESFDKPAFQTGVGAADGARDTPDVAAFADPNPGVCLVVNNGAPQPGTGGTSAATPMWAAIWAVTHQAVHASKGEGAFKAGLTTLYTIGKNIAGSTTLANQPLKDITSGGINGPSGTANFYKGVAGYDMASGWGTPNLARLIAVWQ